jgi:hypothetical protein
VANYRQDPKTGLMLGSTGDGKTRIPTPNDLRAPSSRDHLTQRIDTDLLRTFEAFQTVVPALPEDLEPASSDETEPPAVPDPYTFDEYAQFGRATLDVVGPMVIAAPENSFTESGIATLHERDGSAVFEKQFAIPFLTSPARQEQFKTAIAAALPEAHFEFVRFREPLENLADPNQRPDIQDELTDNPLERFLVRTYQENQTRLQADGVHGKPKKADRAWADLFIVAKYDGRTVYLPVNIKCSEEKKSFDNTGGWATASFVVFGDSQKGSDKKSFYAAIAAGEISSDSVSDYYIWNFTKGNPQSGDQLCTASAHCSYLEFPSPEHKVFTCNPAQSFPLQVNTANAAAARTALSAAAAVSPSPPPMTLLDRRKAFSRMIIAKVREQALKDLESTEQALKAL